jgi:hypothetical protein
LGEKKGHKNHPKKRARARALPFVLARRLRAAGFYNHFYNHSHRLCLEKLLYTGIGLSRSPSGYFKPLLDPGGCFASETAARRFQKWPFRIITVSGAKRLQIYNGHMQRPLANGKAPFRV